MYDTDPDPYLYPGTDVLKNLFGIHSAAKLAKLERRLTSARADEGFPNGSFDYAHYKSTSRSTATCSKTSTNGPASHAR